MVDLVNGDSYIVMKDLEPNSIDALITDPPAGISFMGKEWDKGHNFISDMTAIFYECLRVMKPGAHGLVWALPRTSHWTATALEQAGFEIRDVITHLFGTGFPKSLDISKAIDKAAGVEREVVGKKQYERSPCRADGTIGGNNPNPMSSTEPNQSDKKLQLTAPATDLAKQWEGWGTALKPASEHWILVRKPISEKTIAANVEKWGCGGINIDACRIEAESRARSKEHAQGRFPANLLFDEEAAEMLDEQSGISRSTGGASRFFYVAKSSKSDRGEDNKHPTVKSTKLMEYLITLITPPNGIILDPFMGSGSTGVAAKRLGFKFIGIEKEKEYFEIAEKRINF